MEHSLIQLTILDTSKPVLINVEEVLLIEQKAPNAHHVLLRLKGRRGNARWDGI